LFEVVEVNEIGSQQIFSLVHKFELSKNVWLIWVVLENLEHLFPGSFQIDLSTIFRSDYWQILIVLEVFETFVWNVFQEYPLQFKLSLEFISLEPIFEVFFGLFRNQFCDSQKLARFYNAKDQININIGLFSFKVGCIQCIVVCRGGSPNTVFDCLVHIVIIITSYNEKFGVLNGFDIEGWGVDILKFREGFHDGL